MSALRNMPVVCEGRSIGLLQNIGLNPEQKQVGALIVSCGLRGKRIVMRKDVLSIADGFILVQKVGKYRRALESRPSMFVRDSTGLPVGRIRDYAIARQTLDVLAVEILIGYFPAGLKSRIWAYDYVCTKDGEVIIPASLGSELSVSDSQSLT